MPQPPFQLDVLQVEPGSGDTLTISRDSAAGSMKFVDAVTTSGVLLQNLMGMRNISGVFVVGKTNAPYTTIQDALDAIPETSSAALPSLVYIMPGVYTENLTLQKDGVFIQGFGAVLTNSGDSDTLTISVSSTVVPKAITLKGLEIRCTQDGKSCIKAIGAQNFAQGTVQVINAPLAAGDTLTINGVVLSGVAGLRTSGLDNFSVSGGTPDTIAADIYAALTDTSNSFTTVVTSSVVGDTITVKSPTAGSGGNSITLASSTTPGGGFTLSGATLTGGSSAGTTALNGYLDIVDCVLKASGAGSYQVDADTVNYVRVLGGTFKGSSLTSISKAANCALFEVNNNPWLGDIELSYDTALDRPSDTSSEYTLGYIKRMDGLTSTLTGEGSLSLNFTNAGNIVSGGDRTLDIRSSIVGTITAGDTLSTTLRKSTRSTYTVSGGTPTIQESQLLGSGTFSASTSEAITIPTQPDNTYTVLVTSPDKDISLGVISKTTSSFTIEASASLTGTVDYSLIRNL